MTIFRASTRTVLTPSSRARGAVVRRAVSAVRARQPRFTSPGPRGQTLVEYGLLIALIAVIVIAALLFLGPVVSGLFTNIGNTIQNSH